MMEFTFLWESWGTPWDLFWSTDYKMIDRFSKFYYRESAIGNSDWQKTKDQTAEVSGVRDSARTRFSSSLRHPDPFWDPPSLLSNGYREQKARTWSWPLTFWIPMCCLLLPSRVGSFRRQNFLDTPQLAFLITPGKERKHSIRSSITSTFSSRVSYRLMSSHRQRKNPGLCQERQKLWWIIWTCCSENAFGKIPSRHKLTWELPFGIRHHIVW
jgi:hypothetical protein